MVNDLPVINGTKWNDGLDESELKPSKFTLTQATIPLDRHNHN